MHESEKPLLLLPICADVKIHLFECECVARNPVDSLQCVSWENMRLQGAPLSNVENFDARRIAVFVEHYMHTNARYLFFASTRPRGTDGRSVSYMIIGQRQRLC